MASLLKNQILKHLSKFTKNLSPEKLQMSTMRGSFEVNNIELNEQVLMELLELPVWLSLTKAHCNYASVKINWIKIKTIPIYIVLDEVTIEAETCEDFREVAKFRAANKVNLNQEAGSYGFINKVIDGITLSINSVNVQFRSAIFSASFELTRITIESRSCLWKAVDDLSKTRIRDPARGQVLVFKHIEWQTLRFVAKSETKQSVGQAPLRLIANAASCRLTLKKRLSDSAVLGARIMVIFDDLLWVLTDSQLLSALHFADYLGGLIKRAPRTKTFEGGGGGGGGGTTPEDSQQAKAKLASMGLGVNGSPTRTAARPPPSSPLASSISSLFSQYDFLDTSFHLIVRRIEVHLMDDLGPCSERSQCPELSEGGALQMTFLELFIDLYPYQAVTGSRRHWLRYAEPSTSRAAFINHKLKAFFARQQAAFRREGSNFNLASLQHHLLSRVVVIRLSDYSIGCVSTNGGKSSSSASSANKKTSENGEPPKLIAFDHSAPIPANVNPVYIELNNYFYLEPFDRLNLPLPDTNIFAAVAPVRINFEPLTILWINAFFANLRNALVKLQEAFPPPSSAQEVKVNLRAEILMPTVVLDLTGGNGGDTKTSENGDGDAEKPQPPPLQYSALEVKISRILIYNCDSNLPADYFRSLEALLMYFSSHADFYLEKTAYPWLSCDMPSVSSQFVHQISRWFAASTAAGSAENINEKFEVDFWTISIEPVWVEFRSALTGACEPLLEPINLTLWAHAPSDSASASANNSSPIDMNVFARIADPVKVQLKHGQLLALLRLLERVGDFTAMLNYDTYMIQRSHYKRDVERSNAVAAAEGFDGVYKQPPQPMCSFDIDEKVVKAIFKSMAIATTVPEVSLFLLLREEEREDELAVPLMLNGLHHHLDEVNVGFQQQQTLTPAASTPDLNTEDTGSGSDSLATEPALSHPGIDGTRATTDSLGGLLVDSGESLEFEKISITSSSTATHHHHPLESSGTVAVAPNGIFYTANNTTTTHAHVTLAKPASFHNLSSSSGVTEGDLISLGSATNLARPTNHNQHTSVTASYTRRGTFASNHSFDSASNFRSYLNENDDALSTFSDLSADDSDQASFIAMIQAEEKGGTSANGGDLFFNSPAAAATTELGVEVAEEISENFFDGGGDDTLNGEGVVHQHNQQHQHPPLNRSVVVTPCILPIAAAHQRPKTTYIDLLHVRLENVNIIQQSSKGFLSQIALDTSQLKIEEHQQLTKAQYINLYKAGGGGGLDKSGKNEEKEEELQGETDEKQPQLRVTLRIDAFNKGTLRDEMISVRLQHLPLTLQKETIDLVVDFFNDQVAEKAAPTAVLLEGLTLKIIDRSVRMPPVVFTVPRLKLARNKENKWIVEPGGGGDTLAKDSPQYNQLLLHHLKVFERNLLFDVSDLIREQDRLTAVESRLRGATSDEETQALVDQILTQKELLLQEIELLRKANAELMQSCAGAAGRK